MTYAEILNAALTLPPEKREELVETLRASVGNGNDSARTSILSDAWKKEIARRSAEIDAGTAKYVTYEQMVERARRAAGHNA